MKGLASVALLNFEGISSSNLVSDYFAGRGLPMRPVKLSVRIFPLISVR
jgi:hypothetical protein